MGLQISVGEESRRSSYVIIYKRLVDNIYLDNPEDCFNNANVQKLVWYVMIPAPRRETE